MKDPHDNQVTAPPGGVASANAPESEVPGPGRSSKHRPDRIGHLLFWPVAVGGLALDLWSKNAVFAFLKTRPDYSYSVIDGLLRLVLAENEGAAFGMAAGKQPVLIAVAVVAMFVILGLFLFGGTNQRLTQLAMGLFAAGITGNLYDRVFNDGCVRDFIDVYYRSWHWYTFNVADALLCTAVGLLLVSSFMPQRPLQTRDPQRK
ncbi:MAG TPA: signal peptidase II [Phycisphaerales bacterium]|nr:signal peptidase II [Phycisphaerales bacterium]